MLYNALVYCELYVGSIYSSIYLSRLVPVFCESFFVVDHNIIM
jgi:hypothetical protein